MITDAIAWLNDNSGAVQAIAVIVLVLVTGLYALSTHDIASATRTQADATVAMARDVQQQRQDVDRPYLLIEALDLGSVQWKEIEGTDASDPHNAYPKSLACRVHNAGHGPAKEVTITVLNSLIIYEGQRKDFLGPGDTHEAILKARELATALAAEGPQGFKVWANQQNIPISSESVYDCAICALCTDIHDTPWATYLRLGMTATTDCVRRVVDSRTLVPFEHRIVELEKVHDS